MKILALHFECWHKLISGNSKQTLLNTAKSLTRFIISVTILPSGEGAGMATRITGAWKWWKALVSFFVVFLVHPQLLYKINRVLGNGLVIPFASPSLALPSCQSLIHHRASKLWASVCTELAGKLTYAKQLSTSNCQLQHLCLSPFLLPRHFISLWMTFHFISWPFHLLAIYEIFQPTRYTLTLFKLTRVFAWPKRVQ